MNGYYFFIIAFATLGVYSIAYSLIKLRRLDRRSPDYERECRKYRRTLIGALGLFAIAAIIYIGKIYPYK